MQEYRLYYIRDYASIPTVRTNFYVSGAGGIGKNLCCKALAQCLMPDIECRDDLFFEVGGNNVAFEGYDGQPIIIWNDVRSSQLIRKFGREEFFDIIDTHPTGARQNVKYGSIRLINKINIFNGIEPYRKFLDGLAEGYCDNFGVHDQEDKSQSYRRYFGIINLRENDLEIMINKGIINNSREYEQYEVYRKNGSFARVAEKLSGKAAEQIHHKMLDTVIEKTTDYISKQDVRISDPSYIPDEYSNYGAPIVSSTPEEIIAMDEYFKKMQS